MIKFNFNAKNTVVVGNAVNSNNCQRDIGINATLPVSKERERERTETVISVLVISKRQHGFRMGTNTALSHTYTRGKCKTKESTKCNGKSANAASNCQFTVGARLEQSIDRI